MNFYIYAADVWCEECAKSIKRQLTKKGLRPKLYKDERTFDSDKYPKGPYYDEESDTPQHCGSGKDCLSPEFIGGDLYGKFFENPLTPDGEEYIREQHKENPSDVTRMWMKFYNLEE